jgi:type I restriction enzyme R subunit
MSNILNENTFETNIVEKLVSSGGYIEGNPVDFIPDLALDTNQLFSFLLDSQPDEIDQLIKVHGEDEYQDRLIQRLIKELDLRGTLDCLRNGITDYGVHLNLAYFKPESSLNQETKEKYDQNIISVTRQVHFSEKDPDKSVDLVLFINGLPVATAELKNPFTGQTVENAQKQYIYTRDVRESLFQFKKRALVHFAVDPNLVYMTTQLNGENTKFLPFNKGLNNGAGNPSVESGYQTSYLWEEIWNKDSWMDIIAKYIHLEKKEIKTEGKIITKEKIIFPRYHQLDVVRKLVNDTKRNGTGKNYLIEHSAGSGKSNSIAWLAYRLANLHNDLDQSVFDSVVVVTDRVVLDKQLQDTIYQFDHKQGVVQKIDKDSAQLADALKKGIKIIITTVQKFPFVLDQIDELEAKKYAVIVDEAHGSQGGETSKQMKEVLTFGLHESEDPEDLAEVETAEDEIRKSMASRGKQSNLCFYGFTATPKAKTLEVFGEVGKDGKPRPFHLYSMRQAIEEGFILDVLKSYTTYKTYFRLSKEIEDDPEISKDKANRAIARFLSLHPHNLSQKTEVMVEHFRRVTMKRIGGKAKAMVVTSSRMHAVRYYLEFNKYLKEKNYTDIRTLVAFSGTVIDKDSGAEYKEVEMNGFREKELSEKFNADEYKILLVADKYQTGFDQPLLHTMFVDKKLSGVAAVQTLSRLNRVAPGKEDTFVLDFVNDQATIYESFQPYYELTSLEETANPNHLYDLKHQLEETGIFWQSEVDSFSKVFFKPKQTRADQAELYRLIQPAIERYIALDETKKEEFKKTLTAFIRTYAFLSQIMPFTDTQLEKLYVFARLLRNALPRKNNNNLELNDEIALQYYKLQKISEGSVELSKEGEVNLPGIMGDSGNASTGEDEKSKLSEIIKTLNDRFGTEFSEADKLFFDQIEEELIADQKLQKQALNNEIGNFKYGFNEVFVDKIIDRMEQNQEIFNKIMNNPDFKAVVSDWMLKKVYKKLSQKVSIKSLIKEGEGQNLEFKSSLRWDVKQGKENKDLEKVIMKTLAGFMNSEGGQLIIGVEDNGNVLGLENDYQTLQNGNRDKFETHVVQLIKASLGIEFVQYVRFLFDKIEGKDVCLVTAIKSPKPVYVKYQDKEEFFARTGNSTSPFTLSEAQEFIRTHWN